MSVRASVTPLGFIKPEIPTLAPEPPSGEGWIHEIKHDGYRTLIIIDQGKVRAFSRHGRDWTGPYRRVVEAAGTASPTLMRCAPPSTRLSTALWCLPSISCTSKALICGDHRLWSDGQNSGSWLSLTRVHPSSSAIMSTARELGAALMTFAGGLLIERRTVLVRCAS
jgi:hypothetical protein